MNLPSYFNDPVFAAAFIIAASVCLSVFAYFKGFMTDRAQALAMVTGTLIGILASPTWMLALFLFPIVAFVATRYRFREKEALGVQEGKHGERRFMNILGVTIIPIAISFAYFTRGGDSVFLAVAFLSAVAVSTADTVASEIGPLANRTYMITTLKRIEPGPDGGVSVLGFAASTIAALVFSIIGCFIMLDLGTARFAAACLTVVIAALIGNIADSLLGATLESEGRISKYFNNAVTALIGAVAGFLIYLQIDVLMG